MTEREKLIEVIDRFLSVTFDGDEFVYRDAAIGLLLALEAAGVRLVPVEATKEMIATYWDELPSQFAIDMRDADEARFAIAAVLAASPYAPEGTTHDHHN